MRKFFHGLALAVATILAYGCVFGAPVLEKLTRPAVADGQKSGQNG